MSERNETTILILALLSTLGLVAGAFLWFTQGGIRLTAFSNNQANTDTTNINTFAQVTDVPSGLFSYGGSTTWVPIRSVVDPVIGVVHPQFWLCYTNPTSESPGGSGIKMLLDGQLAFAQYSRSIDNQELDCAKNRGLVFKEIPVAIDGIAITIHLIKLSQCPDQRNQLNSAAFQSGEYPITRRLFVIVKQDGVDQLAGEAYAKLLLTAQGQELIAKAGFVSIR